MDDFNQTLNARGTQYCVPVWSYVVSSRREFTDGAEFKTRGTRSQIPENLGHVPEFGALQERGPRHRLALARKDSEVAF